MTMLQDLDPSKRPGAGPDGYAVLKMHPFFKGVDWKNLRGKTPPRLAPEPGVRFPSYVKLHSTKKSHSPRNPCLSFLKLSLESFTPQSYFFFHFQVPASDSDDAQESPWNPSHIGDSSTRQADGNCGSVSSSDGSGLITRLASIDSFDSKW